MSSVTPWSVSLEDTNYDKLITDFGCSKLTPEHASKLSTHHYFTRNIVFAHRDFDSIYASISNREPIYLYTGRGPSSSSMHLGHVLPFVLSQFLQKEFNLPIVIQITDDEKYIWKNLTKEEVAHYSMENIKDIIAFGFDPDNTFIFLDSVYAPKQSDLLLETELKIPIRRAQKVFGLTDKDPIAKYSFVVKEIAAAFSGFFPFMNRKARALIPAAIDQDPYFRLARDVAEGLGYAKPSTLYLKFLPALNGIKEKMSSSEGTAVFLSDSPNEIADKIRKYAFSGGRETLEEHRRLGGDPNVDVSYQYLVYFMEDDARLKQIYDDYLSGKMLTSELKRTTIDVVSGFVREFQERRGRVTEEVVQRFMSEKKEFRW